jgi:hypothetical protein
VRGQNPQSPRARGRTLITAVLLGASLVLAGCSQGPAEPQEDVESLELLPQSLFPGGGNVTQCPEQPDGAPKDTTGTVPKAVCLTVINSGDDRAVYTVNVDVRTRDEDNPVVISQVVLTTPAVEAGATGAVAIAAPGTERVIDEYAEGQQEAQEAAGLVPADDVELAVVSATRTPA